MAYKINKSAPVDDVTAIRQALAARGLQASITRSGGVIQKIGKVYRDDGHNKLAEVDLSKSADDKAALDAVLVERGYEAISAEAVEEIIK